MLIKTEQVKPLEIFVDGKYLEILEYIKKESRIENPDVSTGKGRALIKSMAAKVASSKVFVVKAGKTLADGEKAKIDKKLTAINTSKSFIDDSLVYLKAEVREPLTKWEEEQKKEEEAALLAAKILEDHAEAVEYNNFLDVKKALAEESKRLEKEKIQLNANQEAVKNFGSVSQVAVNDAVKKQGAAESETERIKKKAIEDEKQAKIDQDKAVEDERVRVQKIADDKETKRLEDERIKRETEEAKAADVTHRKGINNQALAGLVAVLEKNDSLPDIDGIGKQIIIAIIQGKVPHVSVKY